jgi:hypothetical protein
MINKRELNTMHKTNRISVMTDMNFNVMQSTGERIIDEFEARKNNILTDYCLRKRFT